MNLPLGPWPGERAGVAMLQGLEFDSAIPAQPPLVLSRVKVPTETLEGILNRPKLGHRT